MKKIIIVLILIYCGNYTLKSQTIVDPSKVWSVVECANNGFCHTFSYRFNGDTIYCNKYYKRLKRTADSTLTNWYNYGAMREDSSKKVYYLAEYATTEVLWYDFGLTQSDTFTTTINGHPLKMIVANIDSVNYNSGKKLKRITFTNFDKWVEGFGSMFGLTYVGVYEYMFDLYPELNCLTKHDTLLYHNSNYPTCFYTTLNIEELSGNKTILSIYPNPAKEMLTIETNSYTNQSIEIVNIVGQTIYTSAVNNKKTIDVTNFPKGIYVLKLYTDKGIIVKKFIKE